MQAGVSTGRTSTDNCEIVAKLPEIISNATTALPTGYCHMDSPFLTQVKGHGLLHDPEGGRADRRRLPEQPRAAGAGDLHRAHRAGRPLARAAAVGRRRTPRSTC